MTDPDPFAPDEMAQHRRMNACPICFVEDCTEHGGDHQIVEEPKAEVDPPEQPPTDPGLTVAVEKIEPTPAEQWEERADLE